MTPASFNARAMHSENVDMIPSKNNVTFSIFIADSQGNLNHFPKPDDYPKTSMIKSLGYFDGWISKISVTIED